MGIRRVMRRAAALALLLLLAVSFLPQAFAESGKLRMINMDQYSYSFDGSYPEPFKSQSRNRTVQFWLGSIPAYCLQFGVASSSGMEYQTVDVWDGIPASDRQLLNYALMFGFQGSCRYGAQSSQEYMATQVLVWQILEHTVGTSWEQKICDRMMGAGSRAQDVYWKIRDNVFSAAVIPSFCSGSDSGDTPVYELQRSEDGTLSIALTDQAGVLQSFSFSAESAEIAADGSTLSVTAADAGKTITVKGRKNFSGWDGGAAAVWRPSADGYQYLGSFDVLKEADPVMAYFRLEVPSGDIEIRKITKTGEDTAGIEFTLTSEAGEVIRAVTGEDGTAVVEGLPAGVTYLVQEDPETVPTAYRTAAPQSVTVTAGQRTVLTFRNELKTGRIRVRKLDVTDPDDPVPMEGVSFTVTDERGEEVCSITTGRDGTAETGELPLGRYTLTEQCPYGYVPSEPAWAEISDDGDVVSVTVENRLYETELYIVKRDSGTGLPVLRGGTVFRIERSGLLRSADNVTAVTGDDGTARLDGLLTAGEYVIYEVEAPEGYLRASEPIRFSVDPQKDMSGTVTVDFSDDPALGRIEVEKKGLMVTGAEAEETEYGTLFVPAWEERSLEGAVFSIEAAEDISTADGTLRLRKGEKADEVVTGSDGRARSKELYPGLYRVTETKAPEGYRLSGESALVEVRSDSEGEAEISLVSFTDEPETVTAKVRKDLERDPYSGAAPYSEVVIGVFAKEDIAGADGATAIPAGSLVELMLPDGDGNCAGTVMLPLADYSVRELRCPQGYVSDGGEHENGSSIINVLMRGKLVLTKRDSATGEKLSGAKYSLCAANGTEIGRYVTGQDGSFYVDDLPFGEYTLKELDAPDGYIRDKSGIAFRISADGETVEIGAVNDRMPVPDTDGRRPALYGLAAAAASLGMSALWFIRRRRSGGKAV